MTVQEKQRIQNEFDRMCEQVFLIRKDGTINNHIKSHRKTARAEDKICQTYQKAYLELNRELRTDFDNIVHLQEEVPCLFDLPDRNQVCHYAFWINRDVNPKGTVAVTFTSNTPVELYLST
jgi:hypothetical protein